MMARERGGFMARKPEPGAEKARDPAYEPARTPVGAKLRRWRARHIEAGGRLLTWEEIEREVADRRGDVH